MNVNLFLKSECGIRRPTSKVTRKSNITESENESKESPEIIEQTELMNWQRGEKIFAQNRVKLD